jgi:hypothetical protein
MKLIFLSFLPTTIIMLYFTLKLMYFTEWFNSKKFDVEVIKYFLKHKNNIVDFKIFLIFYRFYDWNFDKCLRIYFKHIN